MKCLCGYESNQFNYIKVKLVTSELMYFPDEEREKNIYICPKCGTLKVDLPEEINVKTVIHHGSEDCIHNWVYTSESQMLPVDPPIYETYRICADCGRLEKIQGKGKAEADKHKFKSIFNVYH